jgi:hypothetical protein
LNAGFIELMRLVKDDHTHTEGSNSAMPPIHAPPCLQKINDD